MDGRNSVGSFSEIHRVVKLILFVWLLLFYAINVLKVSFLTLLIAIPECFVKVAQIYLNRPLQLKTIRIKALKTCLKTHIRCTYLFYSVLNA